jgi:hypothetical protein
VGHHRHLRRGLADIRMVGTAMRLGDQLRHIYYAVVQRKHQAFCVHCRSVQQVAVKQYVTTHNTRRNIRRLVGRCTACEATTSTIVG